MKTAGTAGDCGPPAAAPPPAPSAPDRETPFGTPGPGGGAVEGMVGQRLDQGWLSRHGADESSIDKQLGQLREALSRSGQPADLSLDSGHLVQFVCPLVCIQLEAP